MSEQSELAATEIRACLAGVEAMVRRARQLSKEYNEKVRGIPPERATPVELLQMMIDFAEVRSLDLLCKEALERALPSYPSLATRWRVHGNKDYDSPDELVTDLEAKRAILQHALTLLGFPPTSTSYIAPERIRDLQACPRDRFDLTKLTALCEELNVAYSEGLTFATAMLVRAILDHVPPVFGQQSFSQIGANYAGGKSFKDVMNSLEQTSRKIADAYLHAQVRSREVLPTSIQVDFRAALDVLLQEVVRILKN